MPNQVWHITHRCHQKDFLLKFSKDRKRWLHWLFEAKKRFGLCILNYTVTSNLCSKYSNCSGVRAKGRSCKLEGEKFVLKEPDVTYSVVFDDEKVVLSD